MRAVEDRIGKYVHYFRDQIAKVDQIGKDFPNDDDDRFLYKKLLYVSILDALSKPVFPKRQPGDRYVTFLRQFSNWADVDSVSLPHVLQLCMKRPDTEYGKLRTFAKSQIAAWRPGQPVLLSKDPKVEKVKPIWPDLKDYQTDGKKDWRWEALQHGHLFYKYRNGLVHDFRQLGTTLQNYMFDLDEPYYIHISVPQLPEEHWALIYPPKFLEGVCSKSLDQLEQYLRNNSLDPTVHLSFGEYYLDELNEQAPFVAS